jgi:hypothetical protein
MVLNFNIASNQPRITPPSSYSMNECVQLARQHIQNVPPTAEITEGFLASIEQDRNDDNILNGSYTRSTNLRNGRDPEQIEAMVAKYIGVLQLDLDDNQQLDGSVMRNASRSPSASSTQSNLPPFGAPQGFSFKDSYNSALNFAGNKEAWAPITLQQGQLMQQTYLQDVQKDYADDGSYNGSTEFANGGDAESASIQVGTMLLDYKDDKLLNGSIIRKVWQFHHKDDAAAPATSGSYPAGNEPARIQKMKELAQALANKGAEFDSNPYSFTPDALGASLGAIENISGAQVNDPVSLNQINTAIDGLSERQDFLNRNYNAFGQDAANRLGSFYNRMQQGAYFLRYFFNQIAGNDGNRNSISPDDLSDAFAQHGNGSVLTREMMES